jgi:hypothetical protein
MVANPGAAGALRRTLSPLLPQLNPKNTTTYGKRSGHQGTRQASPVQQPSCFARDAARPHPAPGGLQLLLQALGAALKLGAQPLHLTARGRRVGRRPLRRPGLRQRRGRPQMYLVETKRGGGGGGLRQRAHLGV